jgi:exodeoxyribonuclease VII large subunit
VPNQIPFSFDVPSVSELTIKIKNLIESNFTDVLVEGEISNLKQSRNGHCYFTVKDSDAQLPCVMWRSVADRLGSQLIDGQQVILGGDIQVYAPHGRYQMIVTLVEQAGTGKLQQAFEKLKQKLQEEGLFDESHKKQLPAFPERIGVVTSSSGAAFHDIVSTLERRWPLSEVYLYHASVQGINAAPEIVNGINYFCDHKIVDVLIIGRGGGSLEDLWPFNEESVARAVFHCPIPVISAVGHEVDFSISDFVADARAATPTQAAVMATPDINEIRFLVDDMGSGLANLLNDKINRYRETVRRLGESHALLVVESKIRNQRDRIHNLRENMKLRFDRVKTDQREVIRISRDQMEKIMEKTLLSKKEQVTNLSHRLDKRDPNGPLDQGYVRVWQESAWIRNANKFHQKKNFELQWRDEKIQIHPDR